MWPFLRQISRPAVSTSGCCLLSPFHARTLLQCKAVEIYANLRSRHGFLLRVAGVA